MIQLVFKQIEFQNAQHKIDNSFNPFAKRSESISTKRYKAQDRNLPPYLEIDASFNLQSQYFNQITQVFEPFVEPWNLSAFIQQKIENGQFDIKVSSKQLLNLNVTYAMALCLRNISYDILYIIG